jgi:hypothetical protein
VRPQPARHPIAAWTTPSSLATAPWSAVAPTHLAASDLAGGKAMPCITARIPAWQRERSAAPGFRARRVPARNDTCAHRCRAAVTAAGWRRGQPHRRSPIRADSATLDVAIPGLLCGRGRVAPVLNESSALADPPRSDGKHPFACVAADQVSAAFDLLETAPEHSRSQWVWGTM